MVTTPAAAAPTALRSALSHRAEEIRGGDEGPFFMLLNLAAERDDVIRLGRGEPDIPTPPHIIEAAKKALDEGKTAYTHPAGLPALREAIAQSSRVTTACSTTRRARSSSRRAPRKHSPSPCRPLLIRATKSCWPSPRTTPMR